MHNYMKINVILMVCVLYGISESDEQYFSMAT